MKVQVLETLSAWVKFYQIPVSFETTEHFFSIFFQILHQSSGSSDITSLYFLAKLLYTLRNLPKNKFGEILREQTKV